MENSKLVPGAIVKIGPGGAWRGYGARFVRFEGEGDKRRAVCIIAGKVRKLAPERVTHGES